MAESKKRATKPKCESNGIRKRGIWKKTSRKETNLAPEWLFTIRLCVALAFFSVRGGAHWIRITSTTGSVKCQSLGIGLADAVGQIKNNP